MKPIQITAIEGNRQWLDGGSMFGNAPRAIWQKWTEVDEQDRIPLACRCLLIEWNGLKILCEAGIGAFFEPKLAERFGVQDHESHKLLENLNALGIQPEDIDYVILSHLHFDHAGGLLPSYQELSRGHDDLIFPKAQFVIGEKAWQRAQTPHPRDRASFVPLLNKKLSESGRVTLIKNCEVPAQLTGLLSFFESNGHTPGQMHTLVHCKDKDIVFAGDLVPGEAWVHLPITMGYDRFAEKVIEEKQELYNNFDNKNLFLFFTHDPQSAMGRLSKNDKGKFVITEKLTQPIRMEF